MRRAAAGWLIAGWAGLLFLPWYGIERAGFFGFGWLARFPDLDTAPAFLQGSLYGRWWLLPLLALFALPLFTQHVGRDDPRGADMLIRAGAGAFVWVFLQGFLIGLRGWEPGIFAPPGTEAGQPPFGMGGLLVTVAALMLLSEGLAARGWCRGDAFTLGAIASVVALVGVFVFFPVTSILSSAVRDNTGALALGEFWRKMFEPSVWGLDCVTSNLRCGVAWNTLFLAILCGAGTTLLGLAFALIAVRTAFRYKGVLRILTVLPIITPPFVIGLAVILLFGRAGAVSTLLFEYLDVPRSRWIYGLPGILLAQLLAFTPIAFLVLIGVVQGISPSLEEAAQTLRATSWIGFRTVTWPLLRPGVANAFLLGFVESMADFGNPLVLGGNFEVLSTKIFFAVVGAAHDQGRAAVLAIVLLVFTLGAFYAQHRWLGRANYTTVTGKGDSGLPSPLPIAVKIVCYAVALPWAALTFVIYATIVVGGLVESMGRNYTPTLRHYATGFLIEWTDRGLHFVGSAWDSLWTTLYVAAISAPLTAAIGLITAYLLARQNFAGKRTFEFATMLSFAIPGTVVGVSYILAFNVPPIELTGTGIILVICFVFRNMPVGVRAGLAALSQIDKSLDEASLTLGASSWITIRRVVVPLVKSALIAAMVYSFVRAMTAVSAVIFLVSAEYNMATAYIVGRVEAGEFGLAIAYSSALIVIMLIAILGIQLVVGERRLGRRPAPAISVQGAG
jgi:iron(III) transport system permease protein